MKQIPASELKTGDIFTYISDYKPGQEGWLVVKHTPGHFHWRHLLYGTEGIYRDITGLSRVYLVQNNPVDKHQSILDKIKYLDTRYESRHKQGAMPPVS
jgi:uncharacterized protein (DUF2249 family)